MENTKTIEEQVAELTSEQQNKLLKVGKIGVVLQLIGIPGLIMSVLGLWVVINPPITMSAFDLDKVYIGWITMLILVCAYYIGIVVLVKIICPYYSDAKWRYINKTRKMEKK